MSFGASAGQVTAVVGGDGAGKTTLLRLLAGALAPDSGVVRRPGARQTGYLPAGSGIYPDLTVAENLAFRATGYGLPAAVARERTAEYLERAGLAEARDRPAGQLSGGMRQKLGVIAAMLPGPELLVLDEPTTGVDPVSRSGLWWLITRAAAAGSAVVLATSYIDEAERAAWVLALDGGRELAAGTPDEILAGVPGTLRAARSRPAGEAGRRAWRRAGRWRVWEPAGAAAAGEPDEVIAPDLQDAVTIAALARELETAVWEGDSDGGMVKREWGGGRGAGGGMTTGAGPLAECAGVTRTFGSFTAVDRVDLAVRPGEIVGLLGANGAGKTTLLRILLGLLPASAGRVALFGEPPSRGTRRRIGYVPQGLGLYDDLTAAENLRFAAAVFGAAGSAAAGLPPGYAGTPVGRLPLGLQRRVAFTQALAHQPDLLILDEPTSGVDPLGRARLWETISEAAAGGAGVLVTTHYMEEAAECGRLVIMADGRVVAEGTVREIIGDARVTVVQAASWAGAFGALEESGFQVSLAGRTLRVPGAPPEAVRRALGNGAAASGGTRVFAAPATLDERFFELTVPAAQTGASR
ncbi:MAG TPA: ATP-binding cassette domain-containing protein [Streptosporangiaceae bacterium]